MMEIPFTEEYLLNNKLLLRQSKKDFRSPLEAIFLAAAVQAQAGEIVLDINAGVGTASLCLAIRCPQVKVIGLEPQREPVRYAADNIKANHLIGQVEILLGELLKPPPRLAAGTFSHVMVNPFFPDSSKDSGLANIESLTINSHLYLQQWVRFCLLMVRPKGTITLIHPVEHLDQILTHFSGRLGDINLYPLWPAQNKAAKYILIRGTKNSSSSTCLQPGMILQHGSGHYTSAAEQIICHAKSIDW